VSVCVGMFSAFVYVWCTCVCVLARKRARDRETKRKRENMIHRDRQGGRGGGKERDTVLKR